MHKKQDEKEEKNYGVLFLSKMADIIVSGARKEREIHGKSCYRDNGEFIVKENYLISTIFLINATPSMIKSECNFEVLVKGSRIIQSGFVH